MRRNVGTMRAMMLPRETTSSGTPTARINVSPASSRNAMIRPPTAVIGTGADIPYWHHLSTSTDCEVELAVIIGKPGLNIWRKDAMDNVLAIRS